MNKLKSLTNAIDNTFDLITKGKKLDERFKLGEITVEEYKKLNEELNQWYKEKWNEFKNRRDNV